MECNSEIRGNISIQNSKYIGKLENDGGRIAINPDKFDKLITALRTAVDNDGTLDKEATSYNRLALKYKCNKNTIFDPQTLGLFFY